MSIYFDNFVEGRFFRVQSQQSFELFFQYNHHQQLFDSQLIKQLILYEVRKVPQIPEWVKEGVDTASNYKVDRLLVFNYDGKF